MVEKNRNETRISVSLFGSKLTDTLETPEHTIVGIEVNELLSH